MSAKPVQIAVSNYASTPYERGQDTLVVLLDDGRIFQISTGATWTEIKGPWTQAPKTECYPQTGAIYRSNHSGRQYEVLEVARHENGSGLWVVFQSEDRTIPRVAPLGQFGEEFSYVNNLGFGGEEVTHAS